jgi:hypothetical protein
MRDELVRPQYVKITATMLLIHEGIRQPRRAQPPWRQPIPLSEEERPALLRLAYIVRRGLLPGRSPDPALASRLEALLAR